MEKSTGPLYGGVEAGGTRFVCAVGTGPEDIRATARIPTVSPAETIRKVVEFFHHEAPGDSLIAVGIGSFGPLDIDPSSLTFGYITNTPKAGWMNTNIAGMLREALRVPVALDTDVNAAVLGERQWGAARGIDPVIYLTVGTGIGGGGFMHDRMMHGLTHPEMGHIWIPHDMRLDPFAGSCPFHGDCFEGLASGESIKRRWNRSPEELPPDHPAWELESTYLAYGILNLVYTLSPRRIIIGGGVMKKPGLFSQVCRKTRSLLHGYIRSPLLKENLTQFLVRPGLGDLSGVLGSIALAQSLYPVT